eukprot:TRINITY_DN13415_c0_g1_i4.p1 TRINITY_DN13415_c0_g1~~TRINITY_DN13415_c0_g1_i4.p1  ORF type:complete len:203 (-),score=32.20 TRINITY_DN13415_c0_g1_i4:145-753(-)
MEPHLVYFDVEATGLDVDCDEILQIGAVSPSGETFCSFIMPQVEINPGAAAVNKFSVNNGKLCRDGQSFTTVSMQRGIQDFFDWCQQLSQQHGGSTIMLVAHNGRNYDYELLMSCMRRYGVQVPSSFRLRMADTLPSFEPFRREFGNIRLQTLKNSLLNGGSQSHDAVDDSSDLKNVICALAQRQNKTPWNFINVDGAVEDF